MGFALLEGAEILPIISRRAGLDTTFSGTGLAGLRFRGWAILVGWAESRASPTSIMPLVEPIRCSALPGSPAKTTAGTSATQAEIESHPEKTRLKLSEYHPPMMASRMVPRPRTDQY